MYSRTVVPNEEAPRMLGVLDWDGEAGVLPANVGAAGVPSASTRRTLWLPQSLT